MVTPQSTEAVTPRVFFLILVRASLHRVCVIYIELKDLAVTAQLYRSALVPISTCCPLSEVCNAYSVFTP